MRLCLDLEAREVVVLVWQEDELRSIGQGLDVGSECEEGSQAKVEDSAGFWRVHVLCIGSGKHMGIDQGYTRRSKRKQAETKLELCKSSADQAPSAVRELIKGLSCENTTWTGRGSQTDPGWRKLAIKGKR